MYKVFPVENEYKREEVWLLWRGGIETELTFYTASGKLEPIFLFPECPLLSNLATTHFQ